MVVTLEVQSGPAAGTQVEVRPGQTVRVGRHGPAELVLREDTLLSNTHFALEGGEDRCRLRDLGSRFGTRLNGTSVTEAELKDGDRIVAGQTTFVVRTGAGQPAPPPAAAVAPLSPPVAPVAQPAPSPQVQLSGVQSRVLERLNAEPEPLFALLD